MFFLVCLLAGTTSPFTSISESTGVASLMLTMYGRLWKIGGLSLTSFTGMTRRRDTVFGSVFAMPSSGMGLRTS